MEKIIFVVYNDKRGTQNQQKTMNILDLVVSHAHSLWQFLGSYPFLLAVMIFSLIIKLYFTINLAVHMRENKNSHIRRSCFLLILVLVSAMMANSAWILKIMRKFFIPSLSYKLCVLWLRIAWSFTVVQFHSLALFVESLTEKHSLFGTRQKILLTITGTLFASLLTLSIISFNFPYNHSSIELQLMASILQYCAFPVLSLSLLMTILRLRSMRFPRLLRLQVKMFTKTMIFPFLILEAMHIYPFSLIKSYLGNGHAFASASTLVLAYAIFYCARKIIGLRFLNLKTHVESPGGFDFINDFRHVLEQFSTVTNARELGHITRTFFEQAFSIPTYKTHLYIREQTVKNEMEPDEQQPSSHEIIVEDFLNASASASETTNPFKADEVFFADELAFNEFYRNDNGRGTVLELLRKLNADALIPIVEKERLIAYIIIDRYARSVETGDADEFYNDTERDYIQVFTDYLGNIISLLRNRNFDALLYQEKKLEEEVYLRHQEINQYKESIRSFIRTSHEKEIGIIFYKNRRFIFGNQCARDLVKVDLNTHSGHPTTKKLKTIAQQVLEYKSPQTCLIEGNKNEKLVVSGISNIEQNNVIITVHHPEISDFLRKKIELLHDPNDWSFLLCLETTKTGKLTNQLVPGYGETFLNFKVGLLKAALGKKAALLNVPDGDLQSFVDLIHRVGLRETLHTIALQEPLTTPETAIKLFGINPILGFNTTGPPILEKLDNSGTLFIQNVHFLDLETQKYLAEFLRYGVYRRLKSDHKSPSNVRVICSTSKNLHDAMQEGTFSKNLFEELHSNFLMMPSLMSLPGEELDELVAILSKQALAQKTFSNLLGLTERDKQKLFSAHIPSLRELRIKIKSLLIEKSRQHAIDQEEDLFNPAYTISDPELVEAAQLGRHALRNPRIMGTLWKKFKNQNKIAMFLGVNRSSVNRRCKEYNLIP